MGWARRRSHRQHTQKPLRTAAPPQPTVKATSRPGREEGKAERREGPSRRKAAPSGVAWLGVRRANTKPERSSAASGQAGPSSPQWLSGRLWADLWRSSWPAPACSAGSCSSARESPLLLQAGVPESGSSHGSAIPAPLQPESSPCSSSPSVLVLPSGKEPAPPPLAQQPSPSISAASSGQSVPGSRHSQPGPASRPLPISFGPVPH